jgi:hypothetical protein
MQPINFTVAADALRRREWPASAPAVTLRIEAFRSTTGDTFRTEIALMLKPFSHTVISGINGMRRPSRGAHTSPPAPTRPSKTDQPTLASISALRNRSITSIKPTEGSSSTSAVIAAIW